jgi:hypothetical protein
VVRINDAGTAPPQVKRGETIGLMTSYYVVAPNPASTVRITETRVVQYNGQQIMQPIVRTVDKQQGMTSSTAKLPIPPDAQLGEYKVITVIDNGAYRDTKTSSFYVGI